MMTVFVELLECSYMYLYLGKKYRIISERQEKFGALK